VLRRVVQTLDLLSGQLSHAARGIADPQFAFADDLAGRDECAGTDHAVAMHDRAVEYGCVHADQAGVVDRACMHDRGMADRDIAADEQREAVVGVFARMRHMQDRPVLHIRARADADVVHVAAHDHAGPERSVVAEFDIADQVGGRIDVGVCAEPRQDALVRSDVHG